MDPQSLSRQFMWIIFPLVTLALLLFRNRRREVQRRLPPGPWKLPILGNLHQLGSKPDDSLHKLSLKHGPLMFLKLGSIPAVVISSADIVKEAFKFHDAVFSNRPNLYASRNIAYGLDMAFASYGDYWRQLRKVVMIEVLSLKRVESFRAVREDEVANLMAYIRKLSSSCPDTPMDLNKVMLTHVNNIVCRIMFGDKYKERIGEYEDGGSRLHEVLDETMKLLGGFCIVDYFPSLKWMDALTGLKKRVDKNVEDLDSFFDEIIQEHIDSGSTTDHEDLVQVLLSLQKDPAYSTTFSTMKNVKAFLIDVFVAGSDTSAVTLVWIMTQLMRNPRVMTKLQQELQNVVGGKSKVEESDLPQLEYLKLVIKETLRLHPPGPLLVPRETTEQCKIKEYNIPPKTRVFVNAKAIARDPKFWNNPDEFVPERFLEKPRDYKPAKHFDYLPFGVGRRGCPGVNFASAIVELTLANMVHCFDWELPFGMKSDDIDLEDSFRLSTPKKKHLCLVAKTK